MKTKDELKVIRSAVSINGEIYTLVDFQNTKGRVVDSELYDGDGDVVFDEELLEQAQLAADVCIEW